MGKHYDKQPTTEPTMTEQQLMELIIFSVRDVSFLFLQSKIREMERAQDLGPLVKPTEWSSNAAVIHRCSMDIVRRMLDLRHAIQEYDEIAEQLALAAGKALATKG